MVTAATIHMALLGGEGLARVAAASHANRATLVERLSVVPGVAPLFDRPVFHEQVVTLPVPAVGILRSLSAHNLLGGLDLSRDYPELGNAILVCATEKRTADEIGAYAEKLARVVSLLDGPKCKLVPKNI